MIAYRMMDESCVLTYCLHGGPIPLIEAMESETCPAWLETEYCVPTGSVSRMLRTLCQEYGSCGVMAIDGDMVIGKVRVYPAQITGDIQACVQQNPERIVAFDSAALPAKAALDPAALRVHCVQVCDEYRGRGIATGMLEELIGWAREEQWEQLQARGVAQIGPILEWCGSMGVETYRRLGFSEVSREVCQEHVEAIANMRAGHHGDGVKQQWEALGDISIEDAATVYEMALELG